MTTTTGTTCEAGHRIRDLAADLRTHRQRPCLLFVSRSTVHSDLLALRTALEDEASDNLDVIISSPGGNIEAAYLVARELRRRFEQLTIFVPFRAKSAATLLCLVGDELVLGSLGELGPLDQQYDEKQKADGPLSSSWFLRCRAKTNDETGQKPRARNSSPHKFGSCAPGAKTKYAERLLKRYRPALWAEQGPQLLDRLVHAYPTHGFVIDQEEAQDLGLPTRTADAQEATLLDQLSLALIEFGTDQDIISMACFSRNAIAAAQEVLNKMASHDAEEISECPRPSVSRDRTRSKRRARR